jgi:flagellar motor switch protein FliM
MGPEKVVRSRLEDFREYFISEYGVKPNIDISVHGASQAQAETITESLSKKLKLNDVEMEEYEGTTWYSTEDKDGEISISAIYD